MVKNIGFSHAFGLCRLNLILVGLWPYTNESFLKKVISWFIFVLSVVIMTVFVSAAQTLRLISIWGNLYEMTDNIAGNVAIAATTLKMIILYSHKKGRMLTAVMDDWSAEKSREERKVMKTNAKLTRKISITCIILGYGTVLSSLLVKISQLIKITEIENRELMLSTDFPYDYKSSPIFEITLITQFSGMMFSVFGYTGIYSLFVALMLHLSGQLTNLRLSLEKIVTYDTDHKFSERIRIIVQRHIVLNRFSKSIEGVFSFIFLVNLVSCTVVLCIQAFLLVSMISIVDTGALLIHILFLAIFLFHFGTHVFACCYVADKLMVESMAMSSSAYNTEWYNLPPKDVKLLIIIMHRAKKPLEVTAGKFCLVSLGLYAQILRTAGGYLSMLIAVRDRISSS